MPAVSAPDLLDPALLRELDVLRRRLVPRVQSGAAGERVARRRGGTAEFEEHRHYEPGDDLRRIDWLAYARTGEPMLKLFRTEEDAMVRLLLDGSESLRFGDPSKFEVARRLAAAIGYLALSGGQRAQLLVASGGAADAPKGLERVGAPRRGRSGIAGLLRELSASAGGGTVDLCRGLEQAVNLGARPGMLVVISDFFDAGPLLQRLSRARGGGHDVALIQVLAREELSPDYEGDALLEDAETGQTVEVTMDPAALQAYVVRLAAHCESLRGWARQHGASYVRGSTDEPLLDVVRRFVMRSVD